VRLDTEQQSSDDSGCRERADDAEGEPDHDQRELERASDVQGQRALHHR
jgi:hypothetical protein